MEFVTVVGDFMLDPAPDVLYCSMSGTCGRGDMVIGDISLAEVAEFPCNNTLRSTTIDLDFTPNTWFGSTSLLTLACEFFLQQFSIISSVCALEGASRVSSLFSFFSKQVRVL